MADSFKAELRKAFYETGLDLLGATPGDGWRTILVKAGLLVLGAAAGAGVGALILGDHWAARWVFPVLGAWLFHYALYRFASHANSRT